MKAPCVRRALCAPEHAHARPASRQRPAGALARVAPINPPRRRLHSSAHAQTSPELSSPPFARAWRVRGHPSHCHRRPASPALPNPVQPSETSVHAPVKRRRGQSTVAGVHNPAGVRGPGKSLSHFSIHCTDSLYITPRSSPCRWIALGRRGLAGTLAADENTRLRTRTERFRPSSSSSHTSL
jgi:hypothetical protein